MYGSTFLINLKILNFIINILFTLSQSTPKFYLTWLYNQNLSSHRYYSFSSFIFQVSSANFYTETCKRVLSNYTPFDQILKYPLCVVDSLKRAERHALSKVGANISRTPCTQRKPALSNSNTHPGKGKIFRDGIPGEIQSRVWQAKIRRREP